MEMTISCIIIHKSLKINKMFKEFSSGYLQSSKVFQRYTYKIGGMENGQQ